MASKESDPSAARAAGMMKNDRQPTSVTTSSMLTSIGTGNKSATRIAPGLARLSTPLSTPPAQANSAMRLTKQHTMGKKEQIALRFKTTNSRGLIDPDVLGGTWLRNSDHAIQAPITPQSTERGTANTRPRKRD